MTLLRALVLATVSGSAQAALGQSLVDPMRPPNVTVTPGDQGTETVAPSTQLQSVLISRSRKLAIINGQTVALGGRLGEATVSKISETEVVLQYPDRAEVLKLLGGIERKTVRTANGSERRK